jgi:hypothetical protein
VRLDGSVGGLGTLRDTSKPYPIKLSGALDQIKLDVEGTVAEPLDLRLSLAGAKLHELADMLGGPLPKLADFRGTAALNGGEGMWALNALSLKTIRSTLQGGIAIDANSTVPQLKADFTGPYGEKPARSSSPTPEKAPDSGGRVLPNTAIAVNKLPGVDADLSFDATRVRSPGGLPVERVSLGLALKKGELTVKPLRFHTAQGDVHLNFHFTPYTKDSPPKMHAEVDMRHVDLHQLLGRPNIPAMV